MHTVRFLKMNWSMRTKFLKVYAIQHKFSLLVQSLTKTRFANTLEACFSMHKEMKLVLIDDSLKSSSRVWAEWNVVLHSKSSTSTPHFIWTFRPFSSMERLPGKFMMWCKVHVFPTMSSYLKLDSLLSGTLWKQYSCFHSQPGKMKRKFSSFFKSLVIELDKDLYGPDNHLVEVGVWIPGWLNFSL